MMRPRFVLWAGLLAALFAPAALFSHPGDGIVADSKGNVYYTDLKHVWKITPGGQRTIAVRDKHTHELYVDAADNVYGEDSRYEPGTTSWSHSLWKLSPDGVLTTIRPMQAGFREDVSFVRDAHGNQFLLRAKGKTYALIKKDSAGSESIVAARLPRSHLRAANPQGDVYLTQADKLIRVTARGRVHAVAGGLTSEYALGRGNEGLNVLYGLTVQKDGTVLLAHYGGRRLLKIAPQGQVSTVYRSGPSTSPTGVTTFGDKVYVLESGVPGNPYAIKVVVLEAGKAPVTLADYVNTP